MALTAASGSGQSYTQILKSTALIGGSSVVNIIFAIIRNKAMAMLLGPGGVGLMGLYSSIADLTQNLAGLGVQASGVRQIAEAVGTGDTDKVARTATVLRWISILLGLAGALLLVAVSFPVAEFTFQDRHHAAAVMLLSAAIFFRLVSAGQIALIQGMRQVSNLARINMLAAFFSTVISVPMVYFFGEQGIVPSIVATAGITIFTSWWYARKIRIKAPAMSVSQMSEEAAGLLRLGFVFMVGAFLAVGAAYTIRIIVLREDGVVAAGLYQAAWALGGLYAGFILQAMGTDFYPRLTAVAKDNDECNRLVNEQAQISMLLAGPGVMATLTLAPLVIWLLYSPEFFPAVDLLRWICLGMMLRIVAWPMGFILMAKGAQRIYFWTDVAATLVHVGLAWLLVPRVGFIGAGIAFFGLYVWHGILIYLIVHRVTGFRWSSANLKLGLIFLPTSAVVFAAFSVLPLWSATAFGLMVTLISGLYSLKMLFRLLPPDMFPPAIRSWLPRSA